MVFCITRVDGKSSNNGESYTFNNLQNETRNFKANLKVSLEIENNGLASIVILCNNFKVHSKVLPEILNSD